MPHAAQVAPREEEKKVEEDFDMSAFNAMQCVFCMAEFTDSE